MVSFFRTKKPDVFASVFSPIPRSTVEYEPIKFKFKSEDMSKYLRFRSTGSAYKDVSDYRPWPSGVSSSSTSIYTEESETSTKTAESVTSVKSKKSVKGGNNVK